MNILSVKKKRRGEKWSERPIVVLVVLGMDKDRAAKVVKVNLVRVKLAKVKLGKVKAARVKLAKDRAAKVNPVKEVEIHLHPHLYEAAQPFPQQLF